eukprot:3890020-Pyramimonas_sp.AAC.1
MNTLMLDTCRLPSPRSTPDGDSDYCSDSFASDDESEGEGPNACDYNKIVEFCEGAPEQWVSSVQKLLSMPILSDTFTVDRSSLLPPVTSLPPPTLGPRP